MTCERDDQPVPGELSAAWDTAMAAAYEAVAETAGPDAAHAAMPAMAAALSAYTSDVLDPLRRLAAEGALAMTRLRGDAILAAEPVPDSPPEGWAG